MAESSVTSSGLIRVTLVSGAKRADLALPSYVPIAELLPGLAQSSGLLDAQSTYAGYHLTDREGRRIRGEETLAAREVDEGDVLTLTAGVDEPEPRVYDDVVEAMGDVVEAQTRPWDPSTSRRTALSSAALILTVGAFALAIQRPSLLAGVGAGVAAVLLMAAGIVLELTRHEHRAASLMAVAGAGYAFVGGLTGFDRQPVLGYPVALGGAAALVLAGIGMPALGRSRFVLLPVVVASVITVVCGLVIESQDLTGADQGKPWAIGLTVAVLAGSIYPWIALSATRTRVTQAYSDADLVADPAPIDPARVSRDVATGHGLLLGITASVAVLTVVSAPLVVRLGWTGAALVVCACLVQMLRTRQYRDGVEVATGLISGVLGLVATAVSALLLQPTWRPTLALILAVVAAILLVATLVPRSQSIRTGRIGDVAELVALIALLPLLVFAVGIVGAVS